LPRRKEKRQITQPNDNNSLDIILILQEAVLPLQRCPSSFSGHFRFKRVLDVGNELLIVLALASSARALLYFARLAVAFISVLCEYELRT
jgi:hypothetical protein